MADAKTIFLLANLALAFLIAGFVWAHQVEIFRSWRLIDAKSFRAVHAAHWQTLPIWVVAIGLSLAGSIALKGGLIDDLELKAYRETIDPKSPLITLFSPPGGPAPYWADSGFVTDAKGIKTPNQFPLWTADATTLGVGKPVTLTWDNGAGLTFRRMIAVDDRYMFTITDSVENSGAQPVSLRPYALILRREGPKIDDLGSVGIDDLQRFSAGDTDGTPAARRNFE